MDFDVSAEQKARLAALEEVVQACGGPDRGAAVARAGGHDVDLDEKLAGSGVLDGASLLDRVLVAEELARMGLASAFGLRAVLTGGPVAGLDELPGGPLAVVDVDRTGPIRFGPVAESLLVLDGDRARLVDALPERPRPVRSSFGHPYGEVAELPAGRDLGPDAGRLLRGRWRLALAAEIAGNAAAGLDRTAEHLRVREQFGRPLATFQALRHRLAEAAVSAEATRWLTREAAATEDDRQAALAAWYAADTAAALAPELVQLCGARSFTLEFGLHVFTMRLDGLRLEVGGPDRLGGELAATMAEVPR